MKHYKTLPKKLRIGPHDVAVNVVDLNHPDGDETIWGKWRETKQAIELASNLPTASYTVETLLHEIFHAIFTFYNARKDDDEERLVSLLAAAVTQVARDNPNLLAWIARYAK